MKFVKTPIGLIMSSGNHEAMVDYAERMNLKGVLAMLTPAEPLDPATLFGGARPRSTEPAPPR